MDAVDWSRMEAVDWLRSANLEGMPGKLRVKSKPGTSEALRTGWLGSTPVAMTATIPAPEGKRRFELSESTKRDLVSKRMAHLPRWIAP